MFRVRNTTVTGTSARDCAIEYFKTQAVVPFGDVWLCVTTGETVNIDKVA